MSQRDPEAKVTRIVNAAIPEFARDGRAGARIDRIAAASGMNKRLLYHYIGDKDALFAAAVVECSKRLSCTSEEPDADAWRLLCHARAVGVPVDLAAVVRQMTACLDASDEPNDTGSEPMIVLIALEMLESLLPGLLDPWLGQTPDGVARATAHRRLRTRLVHAHEAAVREVAVGEVAVREVAAKPRIILKPDLRQVRHT
jgi:AcrR family transcriptional regulator